MNFLECQRGCGTLVYEIEKGECTPECCGAEMVEPLIHHPDEEGNEKHVPLVHQEGNKLYVKVGFHLASDGRKSLYRMDFLING